MVHPSEESLDFVGENRIVFVGDFDITLSNNLLTRNNRLHSHSVSEMFAILRKPCSRGKKGMFVS